MSNKSTKPLSLPPSTLSILDKRYKQTQLYIEKGIGSPVYKKGVFNSINEILGPPQEWLNKSPEDYFGEPKLELLRVVTIFGIKKGDDFSKVKNTYRKYSKFMHPDKKGHDSAFAILNHAYCYLNDVYLQ